MIPRYSRPEMARLWSDENRFATWLEVEIAATTVLAERGVVPKEALAAIRERARFDVQRIEEIEREVQHDVIAFVSCVAESVGPEGRFLHFGLTSSDVVDTALAILMRDAIDLVRTELVELMDAVRERALRHKHAAMIGRTHGVHAEPMTFGLKLALWHAELQRQLARLERARATIAHGKLSGAVGAFSHLPPEVEEAVCAKLGLVPAPVSSQILQRDRHAEFLAAAAILGGTLEKIATEIRGLARTEIREVEEPFLRGQTGSSAMPHKRNPIICERITGLARVVRGYAQMAMEDQALWGERDISHSSVERIVLPGATGLLHYMLRKMAGVLSGLRVYPERMRANLDLTGGLVFSHRVLLALVDRGLSREEAYRVVQDASMAAVDGGFPFGQALAQGGRFSQEELRGLLDYTPYLAHVDTIFARVGIPIRAEVTR